MKSTPTPAGPRAPAVALPLRLSGLVLHAGDVYDTHVWSLDEGEAWEVVRRGWEGPFQSRLRDALRGALRTQNGGLVIHVLPAADRETEALPANNDVGRFPLLRGVTVPFQTTVGGAAYVVRLKPSFTVCRQEQGAEDGRSGAWRESKAWVRMSVAPGEGDLGDRLTLESAAGLARVLQALHRRCLDAVALEYASLVAEALPRIARGGQPSGLAVQSRLHVAYVCARGEYPRGVPGGVGHRVESDAEEAGREIVAADARSKLDPDRRPAFHRLSPLLDRIFPAPFDEASLRALSREESWIASSVDFTFGAARIRTWAVPGNSGKPSIPSAISVVGIAPPTRARPSGLGDTDLPYDEWASRIFSRDLAEHLGAKF